MTIPEFPSRVRVTADLLNRLRVQANRVDTISAEGMQTSVGPGGVRLRQSPTVDRIQGAQQCVIINRDPEYRTIPAGGVAAILTNSDELYASAQNEPPGILQRIAFHVQHAATGSDGQIVIAAEQIRWGEAGMAYCAGVCRALLTDDTKAALLAAGSPVILHEESNSPGNPKDGEDRWAIVRFGGSGSTLTRVKIGGDNESSNKVIDGTIRGAKWSSDDMTSVATLYDPESPAVITDDGIAYGQTLGGQKCLVVSRQVVVDGTVRGGGILDFDLHNDVWVVAYRSISIPGPGGESVSAFEAYWV